MYNHSTKMLVRSLKKCTWRKLAAFDIKYRFAFLVNRLSMYFLLQS